MGKKITDQKIIEEIILESPYLRLGLCSGGKPYIVPMSFGYKKGNIYLHGSQKGMKMDFLRENSSVCFEMDQYEETLPSNKPCGYYMKYRSVVGFGTATVLEDEKEIREGLGVLIDRYHHEEYNVEDLNIEKLAVIRIEIEDMHGRQYGMDQ